MNRATYVVAQAVVAAVLSADSLFCANDGEKEMINDEKFVGDVRNVVAGDVGPSMAEDLVAFLNDKCDADSKPGTWTCPQTNKSRNEDPVAWCTGQIISTAIGVYDAIAIDDEAHAKGVSFDAFEAARWIRERCSKNQVGNLVSLLDSVYAVAVNV